MCMLHTPIIAHRSGGKHGKSPQGPWAYFFLWLYKPRTKLIIRCPGKGPLCIRFVQDKGWTYLLVHVQTTSPLGCHSPLQCHSLSPPYQVKKLYEKIVIAAGSTPSPWQDSKQPGIRCLQNTSGKSLHIFAVVKRGAVFFIFFFVSWLKLSTRDFIEIFHFLMFSWCGRNEVTNAFCMRLCHARF